MASDAEMVAQPASVNDDNVNGASMATTTTSRLAALPEELLSNISNRLGSDEVFALRLTCRDIEAKTFHQFATEYFAAKCFILSTESLKVLVNISNHQKLRDYLTKVYLAPAEFKATKTHCDHGQPIRSTIRQREALAFYISDQKQLHASGDDKRLLAEAFSKLPAVRLLGLVDSLGALPDGVECRGMQKALRTTGQRPPLTSTGPDHHHHGGLVTLTAPGRPSFTWQTHVWTTLLHAVAESGTSTFTRLETDLDIKSGLSPLMDLNIKKKKNLFPLITKALSNLEELSIQLRTHSLRGRVSDGEKDAHRARESLRALATALPKLTSLKLSFDPEPGNLLAGGFFKAFMDKTAISNLKKLELDSLNVDMKPLASVVCKLKSAVVLSFHAVDIMNGGSWVPILKALAQLPALNHLHLMYNTEEQMRVYFLEQPAPNDMEWAEPTFTDIFGVQDQWEDESSDSDEELPELISEGGVPVEQVTASVPATEPIATTTATTTANVTAKAACKVGAGGKDYKAPGCHPHPERGYYVCIQGQDEIQREIPRFIQQYNTGEHAHEDDMNNAFFNTLIGGGVGVLGGGAAVGAFPGAPPPAAMGGPPAAGAGNAGAGAAGNPMANLQANIAGGINPMAQLQAMFGPPTQVAGNAQNGFATYAFPVQVGHGANPFAMPPQAPAAQQGQTQQAAQTQPGVQTQQAPQQAPQPQPTAQSQPQQASQNQQAGQSATPGPATAQWNLPSWAPTTAGASTDDWVMQDELD